MYRRQRVQCNNCGVTGHYFKECEASVMSYGIILLYQGRLLIVRRKHTFSFLEFIRGNYEGSAQLMFLLQTMFQFIPGYVFSCLNNTSNKT